MPLGIANPFRGRQPGKTATAAPATPQPANQPQPNTHQGPNTGPLTGQTPGASGMQQVQHGNLTLATFSPEELLRQVEERRNSVSFDLSGTARFMDNFNQLWSWTGPILFGLGTIGEIFVVLWE